MNYTLGKQDLLKIGKGLLVALGGALLTYVAQVYPHVNFGVWTPLVAALLSVLVNVGWKVLDGQKA